MNIEGKMKDYSAAVKSISKYLSHDWYEINGVWNKKDLTYSGYYLIDAFLIQSKIDFATKG